MNEDAASPDRPPRRPRSITVTESELVDRLAGVGFRETSDEWRAVCEYLIEYAYGVFVGWLRTRGSVHKAALKVGGGGVLGIARIPPDLLLEDDDDARDLTIRLLLKAIPRFRRVLEDGEWNRSRRASLRTYFIGRCLMDFPDVYQSWRTGRNNQVDLVPVGFDGERLEGLGLQSCGSTPADNVMVRVDIERALRRLPRYMRTIVYLWLDEHTQKDIAQIMRGAGHVCSNRTVRTAIEWFGQEWNRLHLGERDGDG